MNRILCVAAAGLFGFCAAAQVTTSGNNIVVDGEDAVRINGADIQVDVRPGAVVTVVSDGHPTPIHVSQAQVNFPDPEESWKDKVALWLDASNEDSFVFEGAGKSGTLNGESYPTVTHWFDRRGGDGRYYAWASRGLTSTNPMLAEDENGPYVSFGDYKLYGRRVEFYRNDENGATNKVSVPFRFAAIVFGSQQGGGEGLISVYKRKAEFPDDPIASDPISFHKFEAWVDGRSVDPTKQGFNGGWELVMLSDKRADPHSAQGLGMTMINNSYNGGGNYREIILLSELPTEMERRKIERYLAAKWKTDSSSFAPDTGDIRLFGSGSAQIAGGNFSLGGEFAGTVTLGKNAAVDLADTAFAPDSPATPDAQNAKDVWYDPNVENSIKPYDGSPEEYRANSVGWLYNIFELPFMTKYQVMYGSSRTPTWELTARGFGPENVWLDHDSRKTLKNVGCTLRLSEASTDDVTFSFQTGFMVLDTSAGGGTPFLGESISNSGNYLQHRADSSYKIFIPGRSCEGFVTNAALRLNGIGGVKPNERSFNSRPEVMSVVFAEKFPLRCLGSYNNTSVDNRLIHGESIFYSRELSDKERADTEAYLMKKWIGLTPKGYGDPSGMTIAGEGAVTLAERDERPKFAADFSGSVTIPGETLAFTLSSSGDGAVTLEDAIVASSVATADSLTITVRPPVSGGAADGIYTLIDAAVWTGGDELTLDVSNLSAREKRHFSLVRSGGKLLLKIAPPGLRIVVK